MKCGNCKAEWSIGGVSVKPLLTCPFCGHTLVNKNDDQLSTFDGVLRAIISYCGVDGLRDGAKTLSMFRDLAPNLKREQKMYSYFIQSNGNVLLLDALHTTRTEQQVCRHRVAHLMVENHLINESIAFEVCDAFWGALGGEPFADQPIKIEPAVIQKSAPAETKSVPKPTTCTNDEKAPTTQKKEDPIAQLKQKANMGDPKAQCELGVMYRDGKGVEKDEKQAFTWFMKAAHKSQNYPRGQFYVGRCYEYGNGVTKDCKEAVRWYTMAANQGDAYAQINLGLCYQYGDGVEKDYAQAAKLFTEAATQGDPLAYCYLGLLYKKGQGVTKNVEKAFEYINRSAQDGESYGQLQLGYLYLQGVGTERDLNEAFRWHKLAAEQGDEDAQKEVGDCYRAGRGVEKDEREAASWYQKAVASGSKLAIFELAQCYEEGIGVAQDYAKAVSLYQQADDLGHPLAAYFLARYYAEGKGVPEDKQKALAIYEKLANNGETLGLLALFAEYGDRDKVTARECLKLINLVKKNADIFNKVVVKKIPDSCMNIAIDMVDYPETKSDGIAWIQECAENGLARAQVWLGDTYRLGDDLLKDKDKAIYWYEKAAEQGDKKAEEQLKALRKKSLFGSLFS